MQLITLHNKPDGRSYVNFVTQNWDKNLKKMIRNKVMIGKIDTKTNRIIFNNNYTTIKSKFPDLDMLLEDKFPAKEKFETQIVNKTDLENNNSLKVIEIKPSVEYIDSEQIFSNLSLNDIFEGTKNFGYIYFMRHIANNIDLMPILQSSFLYEWRRIFILVSYIIQEEKTVNHLNNWVKKQFTHDFENQLTSQRLSDFFESGINEIEQNKFYQQWYKNIREKEFVALDTTSVSTYSEGIKEAESGYNKKGEDLKQVNICLLFGEESKLPVYQVPYSGSLKDSTILSSILEQFTSIVGKLDITIIMDKGGFSKNNIFYLKKRSIKFIVSVPFTTKKIKDLINLSYKNINNIDNVVFTSGEPIRCATHSINWEGNANVMAHLYYDEYKDIASKNKLYSLVYKKIEEYKKGDLSVLKDPIFSKYIFINNSYDINHNKHLVINQKALNETLFTYGWFLLISNTKFSSQRILSAYRLKDYVEKSFCAYNNTLNLDRFHVHNDTKVKNKMFISLISLIFESHIRKVILDNRHHKSIKYPELLSELLKIKCFTDINGKINIRPLTLGQREIFDIFKVPYPKPIYSNGDFCINIS
jgi:transposase